MIIVAGEQTCLMTDGILIIKYAIWSVVELVLLSASIYCIEFPTQ